MATKTCKGEGVDEYATYLLPGSSISPSPAQKTWFRNVAVVSLVVAAVALALGSVALNNTYREDDRINALQREAAASTAFSSAGARTVSALHSSISAFPFCKQVENLQDCHDLKASVSDTVNKWHNLTDVWNKPHSSNDHIVSALMDNTGAVTAISKAGLTADTSPALAAVQKAAQQYATGNKSACAISTGHLCVIDTAGNGVAVLSKLLVVQPETASHSERRRGYAKECVEGAVGGATTGTIGCVVGPEGCAAAIPVSAAAGCVGNMAVHFVDEHWP
jgi:hypothetical protein